MDPASIEHVFQYGLPTVILFTVGWGLWKSVAWTGLNVVLPLRDRITVHLDAISTIMTRLAETSEHQGRLLEQLTATVAQLSVFMKQAECRSPYPPPHKPT